MNKRYTYKAKRVDNGEWVYGHYVSQDMGPEGRSHLIINTSRGYDIDPETVGQYIFSQGGEEFYEGDIVELDQTDFSESDPYIGELFFNTDITLSTIGYMLNTRSGAVEADIGKYTKIGNIHDDE